VTYSITDKITVWQSWTTRVQHGVRVQESNIVQHGGVSTRNHECWINPRLSPPLMLDSTRGYIIPPWSNIESNIGNWWEKNLHPKRGDCEIDHQGHLPSQNPGRSRKAPDLGVVLRCIPRHPSKALGISSSYKVVLTGNHGKVTTGGVVFTPNVTNYTHTIPITQEAHSG